MDAKQICEPDNGNSLKSLVCKKKKIQENTWWHLPLSVMMAKFVIKIGQIFQPLVKMTYSMLQQFVYGVVQ